MFKVKNLPSNMPTILNDNSLFLGNPESWCETLLKLLIKTYKLSGNCSVTIQPESYIINIGEELPSFIIQVSKGMPVKVSKTKLDNSDGLEIAQSNKIVNSLEEVYEAFKLYTLFLPAYFYALKCHKTILKNLGVAMEPPRFTCFAEHVNYKARRKSGEVTVDVWADLDGLNGSEEWELNLNKVRTNTESFDEILDAISVEYDDEAAMFTTDEGVAQTKKELNTAFDPFKMNLTGDKVENLRSTFFNLMGEGTFQGISLSVSLVYMFRTSQWNASLDFNTLDAAFVLYLEECSMVKKGYQPQDKVNVSFKAPDINTLVAFIEETCYYFKP